MCVTISDFKHSLIFAGKGRAMPIGAHMDVVSANIKLGWEGLTMANTMIYFDTPWTNFS